MPFKTVIKGETSYNISLSIYTDAYIYIHTKSISK